MGTWYVCVTYDASKTIKVKAETDDEARQKALDKAGQISLCHQCSGEIEIGDPLEVKDSWQD